MGWWRNSGGGGRSRGGSASPARSARSTPNTVFGCRSDSHLTRAEGVFGGEPGAPGRLIRNPGRNDAESLPSKVSRLVLNAGESDAHRNPRRWWRRAIRERSPAQAAEDVRGGKVLT